jgi:hypothetical protein
MHDHPPKSDKIERHHPTPSTHGILKQKSKENAKSRRIRKLQLFKDHLMIFKVDFFSILVFVFPCGAKTQNTTFLVAATNQQNTPRQNT